MEKADMAIEMVKQIEEKAGNLKEKMLIRSALVRKIKDLENSKSEDLDIRTYDDDRQSYVYIYPSDAGPSERVKEAIISDLRDHLDTMDASIEFLLNDITEIRENLADLA